jgi:subtilisin family serine protease
MMLSTIPSAATPKPRAHALLLRCLLLLFVIIALVVACGGLGTLSADSTGRPRQLLRLRYATFDPLGAPPVHAESDYVPVPQAGVHPFIIQFSGPIMDDWRAAVSAAGAQIVDYVPDDAYIVLLNVETADALRALPFVRWIGYLQPIYRIDPALVGVSGRTAVQVLLYPGANASEVTQALSQGGGSVYALAAYGQSGLLQADIAPSSLRALAQQATVAWIEPQRTIRLWNDVARGIIDVQPAWNRGGLRGAGQIIAIADSGLDTGLLANISRDFRGRIVAAHALGRPGNWSDPDGHGTHVAGSALGSGLNSGSIPISGDYGRSHAGVAPEASLVVQSLLDAEGELDGLPADLGVLFQQSYNDGARIASNSWGVAEDDGGRVYDSHAQQVDRFMWDHPDMVLLFAAGNDGRDANRDGVVDLGSVTTPATAKNSIAVGSSESMRVTGGYSVGAICATWGQCWPDRFPVLPLRDDRISNNAGGMAAFSSRGPTLDGRLKPDLVAPGTNIVSARSSIALPSHYWGVYDEYYAYDGGTSMSTPLVAGAAAIVRQFYEDVHSHIPSAALVKATLLAGAADITPGQYGGRVEVPAAPNNVEGWGRVDLSNAILPAAPRTISYVDSTPGLLTGQSAVFTYTVASVTVPLRIVLAWTDYPGSPLAAANLVNDLDLQVTMPLSPTASAQPDQQGERINNVRSVAMANPIPGDYVITVRGRNVAFGPQPFALVVTANLATPVPAPVVALRDVPPYAIAGSVLTVTWALSGGSVVTSTSLLWDTSSHASDYAYPFAITLPVTASGTYSAFVTLPESGTVYLAASAWVDRRLYRCAMEEAVNVVTSVKSIFLPLILTYPAPPVTPTPVATTTPQIVVQLVQNGGFEDEAPQSPPWQQMDRLDQSAYLVSDFWPLSGRWSVWLGGMYNDSQQLYQTLSIPPGAAFAALSFHWYLNTEETGAAHDILSVRLLNEAGEVLATMAQIDNTGPRNTWVTTRFGWAGNFPYGGRTVRLSFDMLTDGAHNTNLFVDDISFAASSGPISGAVAGLVEDAGR